MITIICALAENRAIGLRGRLLYRLSDDLRRFKALTTGHTVVMGRNTFLSLPKGALPNRRNIVLSRTAKEPFPGTETFPSLQAALAACRADEEVFIIGGESVYAEALPLAQRLCLTHVKATPAEADAFFPPFCKDDWTLQWAESHDADDRNEVPFVFEDYVRTAASGTKETSKA